MSTRFTRSAALLLAAAASSALAHAQNGSFLFTTTQTETTTWSCVGPVLKNLYPNEIHQFRCEIFFQLAQKWCPRTAFHVMGGDADGDSDYWDPAIFGSIDALQASLLPGGPDINQRTVYFSPAVALGTTVSGLPGLRPGDVGAIVRDGTDGKIKYFITQEQLNDAMGLPTATTLNIDAIAAARHIGIVFSLENTITGVSSACGSPTTALDGAVFFIPTADIVWAGDFTVASILTLGSAFVLYTEAQMDAFVANSGIADRNGACVTAIGDTDALEIDFDNGANGVATGIFCKPNTPQLIFAGETLTGAGVLNTANSGRIHWTGCGPLASLCPSPTLGDRMGMQPTSAVQGLPSSLNGITSAVPCAFVLESSTPEVAPSGTYDIHVAGAGPLVWIGLSLAPEGVGAVPVSVDFASTYLLTTSCFPDLYGPPLAIVFLPTTCGYATLSSIAPNFDVNILAQAFTINGASVDLSTPMMIEVK